MNILIKSAVIIDSSSQFHRQKKDIFISDGIIQKIDDNIKFEGNCELIERPNLYISNGWFDSSVSFGEPGFEERETISNGLETAAKSGFTAVAVNPNTNPIIDSKSGVEFLINTSRLHTTTLHPIGALTKNSEGKEITEMYDMSNSGAIAFGDYKKATSNDNLMKIALQYAQNFDGLVLSFPQNDSIAHGGIANEGENSTKLGLKGNPALAEHLQIARDLFLLEYTGGKLHIPTISTKKSIELIAEAKKKGLQVTCSVAVHNLLLSDKELHGFDSNCKVNPPLRDQEDMEALQNAVRKGLIDVITSDHSPIDIEQKKVEFNQAMYGTIGLESAFGALNSIFELDEIIPCLTNRARKTFGLPTSTIEIGNKAELSLFSPTDEYEFSTDHIYSTSKNSVFLGKALKGKVFGICNGSKVVLNSQN